MKTIIAGSRSITDPKLVDLAIQRSGFKITEIVTGGAQGVDSMALDYAIEHKIDSKVFRAPWKEYGRRAGPLRNIEMAEYVGAQGQLIAIRKGGPASRGTTHMIKVARKMDLKVFVLDI